MRIWSAAEAKEYLWENYQTTKTVAEQPLRIEWIDDKDDGAWWTFQVRFPNEIAIVVVGPRGKIYRQVTLSMDQVAQLR